MQKAIIVDLDGTLINSPMVMPDHNGNVDFSVWVEQTKFSPVNEWCSAIVHAHAQAGNKVIFLTARDDSEKFVTITTNWLVRNGFGYINYELIMRSTSDHRTDDVMKEEAYNNKIKPFYDVLFAIDDKLKNVEMFRRIGVPALHCSEY